MTDTIYGVPVWVSPHLRDKPKFDLSPRMREILTPAFVEDFDRWAADFFGIEYTYLKVPHPFAPGDVVLCTEAGLRALRRHYSQEKTWPLQST